MKHLIAHFAALLFVLSMGCSADKPTPEFAKAKQAYEDAMMATAMDFTSDEFNPVIELLAAVPESNRRERSLARKLISEINAARRDSAARLPTPAAAGPRPSRGGNVAGGIIPPGGCLEKCRSQANMELRHCGCEQPFSGSSVRGGSYDKTVKCEAGSSRECFSTANAKLRACESACAR